MKQWNQKEITCELIKWIISSLISPSLVWATDLVAHIEAPKLESRKSIFVEVYWIKEGKKSFFMNMQNSVSYAFECELTRGCYKRCRKIFSFNSLTLSQTHIFSLSLPSLFLAKVCYVFLAIHVQHLLVSYYSYIMVDMV